MSQKAVCTIGLSFFFVSYIMFSQGSKLAYFQEPIDFAHWFNLIGAVLLFSFNRIFPKNKLCTVASFLTTLGIIAHVGLCTIDFIMWSFGDDDVAREALSEHISNTPAILFPFIIVGPSLLFVGLALHAFNFIKSNTISALMVIVGAPAIGYSFFILKNGTYMVLSCALFVAGLFLLLYNKEKTVTV
ncbi:hypothetical protein FMM05_16305 [Flavobacterium zepuense]|uniref:Uncharacterized protein n=1 Tax=Flavobacterium zepuense TaxID=2593302 RepID=A0A552UX68_9FLAO|nr:hypothetical protein [Flavobacterium zepuense]TRW22816.1 hypothetical protein FMM05_16305 [Flavobacterium zepuense]